MPSENFSAIASFLLAAATSALMLYGAYWAFAIRRARASRLYKRQALTVGIVGVYFAALWVASPFTDDLVPRTVQL
jgi:hypothetical protein